MPFGLPLRRAAHRDVHGRRAHRPGHLGRRDRPTRRRAPAPVAQTWTSAASADWGTTAVALAAGKDRLTSLDLGGQSGTRFVLQVEAVAAKAGDLVVATPGVGTDAAVAFPAGTSAATTLVTTDADGRVRLRSTVAVVLRLTVVGHVAGTPGASAAAGDTVLVPASTMVDQATGVGGVVPASGASVVPVAALHGVPAQGARAVWLSVAARGVGSGSIVFGAASSARVRHLHVDVGHLPRARTGRRGRCGPVQRLGAPDGPAGHRRRLGGRRCRRPRPVRCPSPRRATCSVPRSPAPRAVRVVGGAVPAKVDKVLVQVGVKVSLVPGALRVAATKTGLAAGAGAPLPLLGRTTVTVLAPVAADGTLVVSVPLLAQVTSLTVIGYTSAPVAASADTVAPTLTIVSPSRRRHHAGRDAAAHRGRQRVRRRLRRARRAGGGGRRGPRRCRARPGPRCRAVAPRCPGRCRHPHPAGHRDGLGRSLDERQPHHHRHGRRSDGDRRRAGRHRPRGRRPGRDPVVRRRRGRVLGDRARARRRHPGQRRRTDRARRHAAPGRVGRARRCDLGRAHHERLADGRDPAGGHRPAGRAARGRRRRDRRGDGCRRCCTRGPISGCPRGDRAGVLLHHRARAVHATPAGRSSSGCRRR